MKLMDSNETIQSRSLTQWFQQLFRYAIVGGIAAVCDLAVFSFLTGHLQINYLIATPMAFLVATTVNFLLCLKFVFALKGHSPLEASWKKLSSSLISLAINVAAMFIMVELLAFDQLSFELSGAPDGLLLARGIAILLSFFVNFSLTKYYAFRDY